MSDLRVTSNTSSVAAAGPVRKATALAKTASTITSVPNVQALGDPGGAYNTAAVSFGASVDPSSVGIINYQVVAVDQSLVGLGSALYPTTEALVDSLNSTDVQHQPVANYISIGVDAGGQLQGGAGYEIVFGNPAFGYLVNIPDLAADRYIILMKAQDGGFNWTDIAYTPDTSPYTDAVEESVEVNGPSTAVQTSLYKIFPNPAYTGENVLKMYVPASLRAEDLKVKIFALGGAPVRAIEGRWVLERSDKQVDGRTVNLASFLWDQKNDKGSRLPAAPYYYVVSAGKQAVKKDLLGIQWVTRGKK
jgi:hypothetical protein